MFVAAAAAASAVFSAVAAAAVFWNCQVTERTAGEDGSRQGPHGKWDLRSPDAVFFFCFSAFSATPIY